MNRHVITSYTWTYPAVVVIQTVQYTTVITVYNTTTHSPVTNWLIEPSSHPSPTCALCLFNRCTSSQSWAQSVFIPFIYQQRWVNKTPQTSQFLLARDSKVHLSHKKLHYSIVVYEAQPMKISSHWVGRGEVQLRMPPWHVSDLLKKKKKRTSFKGAGITFW